MSSAHSRPPLALSIALGIAGCVAQPTAADSKDTKAPAFAAAGSEVSAGPGAACSDEAKFVYVLSEVGDLYRFDPGTLAIAKLFPVSCRSSSRDPRLDFILSMAVDRQGSAWVQYANGQMWKVDVTNGACQEMAYAPVPTNRILTGMAFVANAANASAETLFVTGGDYDSYDSNTQLFDAQVTFVGSVDPTSFRSSTLGMISDTFLNGQITGSGDGRLFAYYEDPASGQPSTEDAKVAELDKTTGRATTVRPLPGIRMYPGFAVAFWGGDLWIFNGNVETQANSMLARVDPGSGKLDVMIPDVGFDVAGAAVSTCAPTTGVK